MKHHENIRGVTESNAPSQLEQEMKGRFYRQFPTLDGKYGWDARKEVLLFLQQEKVRWAEEIRKECEKLKWGQAPHFGYQGLVMGIDEAKTDKMWEQHDSVLQDIINYLDTLQ